MKTALIVLALVCLPLAQACLAAGQPAEAPAVGLSSGQVKFSSPPTVAKAGDQWKIAFTASALTDVEVAVLDGKGRVVRHLAAGLLGPNAPAPFKAGSLSQEIAWDGKDDEGKKAEGGPFKVRVRLGSQAKLGRQLGRSGQAGGEFYCGLAVGRDGELYVLMSNQTYGRSELRVLDKNGKYLRTIMPYPAGTPESRLKGLGRLTVGGEALPVVFSAHAHSVQPLTEGMSRQSILVHPKGYLVLASAVGTIANHGPPRHLLAMHPEGGSPDGVSYVGPQLVQPRGFFGGAGESGAPAYDGIAASPDGQWLYVTTNIESAHFKNFRKHCVWRVRWADAALGEPFLGQAKAGDDDAHFNDPQGVATDAGGNVYVCDRGNNRVMVFDPNAKLLGKFTVDQPQQIAVHPKMGEIYVVSRPPGAANKISGTTLRKFAAWKDGKAAELIKADTGKKVIEVFAIDPAASPARLWVSLNAGWRNWQVVPVSEKDGAFQLGQSVTDNGSGLCYPMFVHADEPRGRLYVTEMHNGVACVDLKTGGVRPLITGAKANEAVPAPDGSLYITRGWAVILARADSTTGKKIDFGPGTKALGPWPMEKGGQEEDLLARSKGPQVGDRGHVVGPNGDIYILVMSQDGPGRVDVYTADGKLKKQGLIDGIPHGSSGLAVDAAGNVYMGVNLRPTTGALFPHGFAGQVPDKGWTYWKAKRDGIWWYPYFNTYLYHWGSLIKFSPKGGKFYVWGTTSGNKVTPKPEVPAGAAEYRSGYLNMSIAVEGAQWLYAGCGPVPTMGLNWGDPSCTCNNSRPAVDRFGRVFVPDVFRFSVEMLDGNGNQIARIGRYGNADDAGASGGKPAAPRIGFAWPAFVAAGEDGIYVSDPVNRRVTAVGFDHAAEAVCELNR